MYYAQAYADDGVVMIAGKFIVVRAVVRRNGQNRAHTLQA